MRLTDVLAFFASVVAYAAAVAGFSEIQPQNVLASGFALLGSVAALIGGLIVSELRTISHALCDLLDSVRVCPACDCVFCDGPEPHDSQKTSDDGRVRQD